MAIKEPILWARQYILSSEVEYIPCLPSKFGEAVTRIPRGAELTFVEKIDPDLYRVEWASLKDHHVKYTCFMASVWFDCLLPFRKKF